MLDLLSQCAELFRSLGRSASERGAPAIDYAELEGLRNALDRWPAADSQAQGEPLLAMTGEAGIVSATPASQVHYAGKNHDTTAQDHLHLSSGGATRMQAGRGISVFAQDDGISAIAQRGKVRVQAQDDDILFNAQKSFHVSAGEGEVLISAPTIRLVADDGSYIRIGGGVEIGTSGKAIVHASDHDWLEPKTQSTEKMTFAGSSADQRLVFHYPGHQDLCPRPAAEQPYAIELDDGSSLKGLTDAAGRTPVVEREAMRKAAFSARREVPPQSAGQSKGDDS